jgi:hypothetical protein
MADLGRPLKGEEPRIRVSFRMEPTTLLELTSWTKSSPGELLEALHSILASGKRPEGISQGFSSTSYLFRPRKCYKITAATSGVFDF